MKKIPKEYKTIPKGYKITEEDVKSARFEILEKNIYITKEFQYIHELAEVLIILNEHLPDKFPKIEISERTKESMTIKFNRRINITSEGKNKTLVFKREESTPQAVYDIELLFKIFERYKDNKNRILWSAGLPWEFHGSVFYQEYVGQVGHEAMVEMMSKIGYDITTINRYKRKYRKLLKHARFEIFQKAIIEYKNLNKSGRYTFDEIIKRIDIDVSIEEIKEWHEKQLFYKYIKFDFEKKIIKCWPHEFSTR